MSAEIHAVNHRAGCTRDGIQLIAPKKFSTQQEAVHPAAQWRRFIFSIALILTGVFLIAAPGWNSYGAKSEYFDRTNIAQPVGKQWSQRTRTPYATAAVQAVANPVTGAFRALAVWLAPPNFGAVLIVSILLTVLLVRRLLVQRRSPLIAPNDGVGAKWLTRNVEYAEFKRHLAVPRALLNNPYSSEFPDLTLEQRVAIAAEASARADRRIGAIVIQLSQALEPACCSGQDQPADDVPSVIAPRPHSQNVLGELEAALRASLRQSDYVGAVNDNSLVIFISLLNTKADLISIAERLEGVAGRTIASLGAPSHTVSEPGIAMYPIDGYAAGDLYEVARRRADSKARQIAPELFTPVAALADQSMSA